MKLPDLKLPVFTGKYLEFPSWLDHFEATIGKVRLEDSQKLCLLLQYLKDEPAKLIEGLLVTNNNYSYAIEKLKKNYGDPNLLLGLFVSELQTLKGHSADFSATAVKNSTRLYKFGYNSKSQFKKKNYDFIL